MTQFSKSILLRSLDSKLYGVITPFSITIITRGEDHIASFSEANIHASGDTLKEAILNLKDMIVASFEILADHSDSTLGKAMLLEKQVLDRFIYTIQ